MYYSLPGRKWDIFEPSVKMSTYLVAFVVSDFKPSRNNGTKIWSRRDLMDDLEYADEQAQIYLNYYSDKLKVPYALPKMDVIAVPDFSAGAMENWGAVTIR